MRPASTLRGSPSLAPVTAPRHACPRCHGRLEEPTCRLAGVTNGWLSWATSVARRPRRARGLCICPRNHADRARPDRGRCVPCPPRLAHELVQLARRQLLAPATEFVYILTPFTRRRPPGRPRRSWVLVLGRNPNPAGRGCAFTPLDVRQDRPPASVPSVRRGLLHRLEGLYPGISHIGSLQAQRAIQTRW